MFGVVIRGRNALEAVEQIEAAEAAGIEAVWATMFGAGGVDMIPVFAAAAARTSRIKVGTAIVHTWSRHPVVLAQEAMAIDQIAPGRFRLGLGSSTRFYVERLYGMEYRKPLSNLREYLQTVRQLLATGSAEFEGEHVHTRARLGVSAPGVPVMASALREASFEVCGALSDGAISWMCPLRYIEKRALPALEHGARDAGVQTPPLVAHVPIALDVSRGEAHDRARSLLAMYARVPNYQRMFRDAGYDVSDGYGDDLLDDLVLCGSVEEVSAGLRRWHDAGVEVMAQPLIEPGDAAGLAATFGALRRAAQP